MKIAGTFVVREYYEVDSAQATEVITLMENDGAPSTKQAIKVFAQWLYEMSPVQWTSENVTNCNKPTNN
jgi:hypothetical protein